jgi:hypothetical protein
MIDRIAHRDNIFPILSNRMISEKKQLQHGHNDKACGNQVNTEKPELHQLVPTEQPASRSVASCAAAAWPQQQGLWQPGEHRKTGAASAGTY